MAEQMSVLARRTRGHTPDGMGAKFPERIVANLFGDSRKGPRMGAEPRNDDFLSELIMFADRGPFTESVVLAV